MSQRLADLVLHRGGKKPVLRAASWSWAGGRGGGRESQAPGPLGPGARDREGREPASVSLFAQRGCRCTVLGRLRTWLNPAQSEHVSLVNELVIRGARSRLKLVLGTFKELGIYQDFSLERTLEQDEVTCELVNVLHGTEPERGFLP